MAIRDTDVYKFGWRQAPQGAAFGSAAPSALMGAGVAAALASESDCAPIHRAFRGLLQHKPHLPVCIGEESLT